MNRTIGTLLAVLILAAVPTVVSAQAWRGSGRVHGVVVDQETSEPIQGAKVVLVSLRAGRVGPKPIVTDKRGKWAALGLIGGEWHVDVEAEGYVTVQRSFALNELERLPAMKIELERVPPPQPTEEGVVQIGGQSISPEVIAAIEAGNAFMLAEKYKEAVVEYEKALASAPQITQIKRALAQAYYRGGIEAEALRLLTELNAENPEELTDAYTLASIYLQKEKYDEAKAVLNQVPLERFSDPVLLLEVGKHFYNANRGEDALTFFSRAVDVDPARGESYYYRGLAALMSKKISEAKADFEKVIELAPGSPEAADATEMLKSLK